jgi:hypothetical protein
LKRALTHAERVPVEKQMLTGEVETLTKELHKNQSVLKGSAEPG